MKQDETSLERWLGDVPAAQALIALADLQPDAAVYVVDRERTVLHWNGAAERLLGFASDEVVGEHCHRASRCAACVEGCGIARHHEVRNVPLALHSKGGQVVHVLKSGRAFFDERGDFAGGIEVLTANPLSRASSAAPEGKSTEFRGIVTRSPAMAEVFRAIRAVAKTDAPTLVGGESGTGKELVAQAIHAESKREAGPFVALNCAAIVPTLLESELFGHVKGAFTGATHNRDGLLVQADGGTLFLDEVAEMPLELQAKLLRVLERACFVPVGGRQQVCVDVRFVAATHRALQRQVELGKFREDLMYRMRVVPISLPPLRERRGDIGPLAWHFIEQHNKLGGRRIDAVSDATMAAFEAYAWPGNVREFQNAITYAFAIGSGPELTSDELPVELADATGVQPRVAVAKQRAETEADRIRSALIACDGHVGNAADSLGMSRPTLWRKRRRYGIR